MSDQVIVRVSVRVRVRVRVVVRVKVRVIMRVMESVREWMATFILFWAISACLLVSVSASALFCASAAWEVRS